MQVIGVPAAHARRLRKERAKKAAAFLIGAGLCLGFVILARPGQVVMIAGLAAAALAGGVGWYWVGQVGKASRGIASEAKVSKVLSKLGEGGVVINGWRPGGKGGDVDHTIIGPWACVVETKTGYGKLGVKNGVVYSGDRRVGSDEMGQIARASREVGRLLGVRAMAIVCVAGASGGPIQVGEVTVCTSSDLAKIVKNSGAVIPPDHVEAAAKRILGGGTVG